MAGAREQSDFTLILGGSHAGRHDYARGVAGTYGLPIASLGWRGAGGAEALPNSLAPFDAVSRERQPGRVLLLADLQPWLVSARHDDADALLTAIDRTAGPLIVVSREAGMGIVPLEADQRRHRDDLGRLNQALSRRAARTVLVVAGLPLTLGSAS